MSSPSSTKRTILGILSILFLAIGFFLLVQSGVKSTWAGTWIRVGAFLGVCWLAFPQLEKLQTKLPAILTGSALVCLLILATRPNLGKIVVTLAVVAISINGALKWLNAKVPVAPTNQKKH